MFQPKSPETRIREALSSLLATHRFFGVLALRMPFSPGPVKTVAGDGISFTFNPEWIANPETTVDEIKGSIAHIVFACALKHHTRRGEREYGKWNAASRLATAPLLEAEDIWVPPNVAQLGRAFQGLDDLPIELIYERMEDPDEDEDGEPGGGGAGGMPSAGGSQGQPDQQQDPGQGSGDGGGDGQPPPGQQDQSGGGGDQPQQSPQQGQDPGQGNGTPDRQTSPDTPGEVQDAPQEKREEQDQKWDRASKQALQVSKSTGSDPGRIEQEFDGQHDHRRDWQDILREYFRAVAPTDYSWTRPNRRFIDSGLYLPSLYGEGMGPLVVAIDTSGSVDDDHINRACAEIFEIASEVKPDRIHVIQCDAAVTDVMDFDPENPPAEIVIRGRGGTRFQPVFDRIAEEEIEPDVLIYLTDLMGPAPEEPGYPVIWGVETEAQEANVPFGQSLVVPQE